MIGAKDALRIFRVASWTTDAEVDAFAREADVPVDDAPKFLGTVADATLHSDKAAHARRLKAFAALAERWIDPRLFVPYARALATPDASLRALLASLLPRVNNTAAHAELCMVLGHDNPVVREAVAGVLQNVGGKAAFEALIKISGSASFGGRIEALKVMVPKALHQSAPYVELVLGVGSPEEKGFALRLVGDSRYFGRDPENAIALASLALKDPDVRVVTLAVAAIAQYAGEADFYAMVAPLLTSGNPALQKAAIDALWRYPTPRTTAVLERVFRTSSTAIRVAVLDTVQKMASDRALPLLIDALSTKQPLIATKAIEVVSQLSADGKLDAAKAILWLLRRKDVEVRRVAIELVNRVGDKTGDLVPRLLQLLRDEDWWIRERTMDALADIAGRTLTRHLIQFLVDPSDVVRRFAIGALKRLKDPISLRALHEVATGDKDWWVCEEAIAAMGAIGDPQIVPHLVQLLKTRKDLRIACLEALCALKASSALPAIVELLVEDDPDVQVLAIRAMGELGSQAQADAVTPCLKSDSARVRIAAGKLLEYWDSTVVAGKTLGQSLDTLLAVVVEEGADDLLLLAERIPILKRAGRVESMTQFRVLPDAHVRALVYPVLSLGQRKDIEANRDVDFSYTEKTTGARFRINLFQQSTGLGAVCRIVRNDPVLRDIERLGLPESVVGLTDFKNGLVLLGGPTGSGKSTTLAAMLERINRTSSRHILTIEDPIEVLHKADRCLITQREVGTHSSSFKNALRAALREDPDVILIGELRDLATIEMAVTAAETGHLVLATVHTASADTAIDRLVNTFPASLQPQVRTALAESLRAVVCQNLLRRATGNGRVLAVEVMIMNDAIATLIRKGKAFQISQVITTSREQGMQLMDHDLARLVREGTVSVDDAYVRAIDKKMFEALVAGNVPLAGAVRPSAAGHPSVLPLASKSPSVAPSGIRSPTMAPSAMPSIPPAGAVRSPTIVPSPGVPSPGAGRGPTMAPGARAPSIVPGPAPMPTPVPGPRSPTTIGAGAARGPSTVPPAAGRGSPSAPSPPTGVSPPNPSRRPPPQ